MAIRQAAGAPVGLTLAMADDQVEPGGKAALAAHRRHQEDPYLAVARGDDFIGVQTYTRHRFGLEGMLDPEPGIPRTMMGYEFWPQALGATIRRAATATGVPVLVTKNGVATDDDTQRITFIRQALHSVLDYLERWPTALLRIVDADSGQRPLIGRRTVTVPGGGGRRLSRAPGHLQPARPEWAGVHLRQGRALRRSNFNRRVWQPATRAAGVEGLRFHDLRHSSATLSIAAGRARGS
jgi:hypothetical protein